MCGNFNILLHYNREVLPHDVPHMSDMWEMIFINKCG